MKRDINHAFRLYAGAVSEHFGLFDSEVAIVLQDFTERVNQAKAGDVIAAKKLLAYLRACLMSGEVPDSLVAQWAASCIFDVTHHDVSADKAFSLIPETGRPSKGGEQLVSLVTWEDVEVLRATEGLNKTSAIAAHYEQRQLLATQMWLLHREQVQVPAEATLTRQYRQGARIVKRYIQETGQKPPAF
ncbi:hypothetical protein LZG37_00295 [Halomonas titanicae]|uniref:hypothetical protein n=1 Tax=Vreelandella titanicae TaxID=664683 RepID=UPI001F1F806D|nr:hypothetical protein [Halomonas titanicae]MCE7516564.1 hypothetical protein [Halomonas titanicae]